MIINKKLLDDLAPVKEEYKNQIKEIDTFSPCDNDLLYYDLEE